MIGILSDPLGNDPVVEGHPHLEPAVMAGPLSLPGDLRHGEIELLERLALRRPGLAPGHPETAVVNQAELYHAAIS